MKIYTDSDDLDEIKSVKDFFRIMFPEQSLIKHGYIYRGQENWSWQLIPSIFRLKNFSNGKWTWAGVEMFILQEFFRESEAYLKNFTGTTFRKMMIVQHYGAPTRLLDWTTNPLVALYFACYNLSNNDSDGAFYIAQTSKTLTGAVDKISDNQINNYDFCTLIPTKFDDRILAQNGIFTTHSLPSELNEFTPLERKGTENNNNIFKFRIQNKFKAKIKLELEMLGINHAKLFPGLDGIGTNINWMFSRHNHWQESINHWNPPSVQ